MSVCCCSLAGTDACKNCRNNSDVSLSKLNERIFVTKPEIYSEFKPKTNGDRIRLMSDEELVGQFAEEMGFCCPVKGIDCSLEPDCRVCFARWLKQEANE